MTFLDHVFPLEGRQLQLVQLVLPNGDSPATGINSRNRSYTIPNMKWDALLYFHKNSGYPTPAQTVMEIRSLVDFDTQEFFGCTAVVLSTGWNKNETVYHGPGTVEYESRDSMVVAGAKLFPRSYGRAELGAVLTYLVQKVEVCEKKEERVSRTVRGGVGGQNGTFAAYGSLMEPE